MSGVRRGWGWFPAGSSYTKRVRVSHINQPFYELFLAFLPGFQCRHAHCPSPSLRPIHSIASIDHCQTPDGGCLSYRGAASCFLPEIIHGRHPFPFLVTRCDTLPTVPRSCCTLRQNLVKEINFFSPVQLLRRAVAKRRTRRGFAGRRVPPRSSASRIPQANSTQERQEGGQRP